MNDLDRKIAELKGVKPDLVQATGPTGNPIGRPGHLLAPTWEPWSTSDPKALELVDELVHEQNNRLVKFDFIMGLMRRDPWTWRAVFTKEGGFRVSNHLAGEAPTRPEAICRAYIAAVTWMREKTKARKQICPECKSDNLWEKTLGWLGPEEENPAGAGCVDCKWRGTISQTFEAAREWMNNEGKAPQCK